MKTCVWCNAEKENEFGLCGNCHRFPPMSNFKITNMKESIIIDHNTGKITLDEIQDDVNSAKHKGLSGLFAFTPETVQALIDKLKELPNVTQEDINFIGFSLNQSWNVANQRLQNEKNLGDIERKMLESERNRAKILMAKLDIF